MGSRKCLLLATCSWLGRWDRAHCLWQRVWWVRFGINNVCSLLKQAISVAVLGSLNSSVDCVYLFVIYALDFSINYAKCKQSWICVQFLYIQCRISCIRNLAFRVYSHSFLVLWQQQCLVLPAMSCLIANFDNSNKKINALVV